MDMDRILPIGTVVEARGLKLILLGAILLEQDGKMVTGYHAVKYPRGFAGSESLGQLAASEITKVWAKGYEDAIGERYNLGLGGLYHAAEGKTPEEADEMLKAANEEWLKQQEKRQQSAQGRSQAAQDES